jgi:hypothetical protein
VTTLKYDLAGCSRAMEVSQACQTMAQHIDCQADEETGTQLVETVTAAHRYPAPDTWALSRSTLWAGVRCPEPIGGQDAPLAQEHRLRGVPTRHDRCPPLPLHPHPVVLHHVQSLALVVSPETDRQVTKKKGRASRANALEWESGRRDARDAAERLCPTFSSVGAAECRCFAAESVTLSNRFWDDAPCSKSTVTLLLALDESRPGHTLD